MKPVVFFGKTSRGCIKCGHIKRYEEFNNSRREEILCKLCAAILDQELMLSSLDEFQQDEIELLEDQIEDNELAYEEALARQEFIDYTMQMLED